MARYTVRGDAFVMRVNQDESQMIEQLARYLQRSRSDTVRLLIREALKGLEEIQSDNASTCIDIDDKQRGWGNEHIARNY